MSLLFTASLGAGLVYNESSYRSTVQNLEGQIDLIQDQWEEDNETSMLAGRALSAAALRARDGGLQRGQHREDAMP